MKIYSITAKTLKYKIKEVKKNPTDVKFEAEKALNILGFFSLKNMYFLNKQKHNSLIQWIRYFLLKQTGLCREMAEFKFEARNVWVDPGASHARRKDVIKD